MTEIAKETPRVDETERSMIVDYTTVHTYSDQEEEDTGGVLESATAVADQSGQELLDMSTHGSGDPMGYTPDQHNISELREDIAVTDPTVSVDKTDASHLEIEADYAQQTKLEKVV